MVVGNDRGFVGILCSLLLKELVAGGVRYLDLGGVEGFYSLSCACRHDRNLFEQGLCYNLRRGLFHAGNKAAHERLAVAVAAVVAQEDDLAVSDRNVDIERSLGVAERERNDLCRLAADLAKGKALALIGEHHVGRDIIGARYFCKRINIVFHAVQKLFAGGFYQLGDLDLALQRAVDREGLYEHGNGTRKPRVVSAVIDRGVDSLGFVVVFCKHKGENRVVKGV